MRSVTCLFSVLAFVRVDILSSGRRRVAQAIAMSRFTMKDSICAAQRCISTGSPQRAVKSSNVHSTLLSTFEAELARLQTQDENLSSSKTSNGMGGIDISGSPRLGSGASVYPANLKSAPQVEKKAQYNEQSNFLLYTYKLGSPTPVRIYIRDEAEANEQVLKLRGYDVCCYLGP